MPADLKLISEQTLAELTGLKVTTIQHLRRCGKGPPFVKVGFLVRYQLADVQAWMDAQKRTSTAGGAS